MNVKPKSKLKSAAVSEDRAIMSFDFAMKGLLRDKANSGILSGFLTELLGKGVVVTAILESEGNVESKGDKVNRLDIKAQIDGGETVIVEIQYNDQYDFIGKALFNVGRAIVEQIKAGGLYDVRKVYMISILEFDIGAEQEYLFNARMGGFKGVHYNEVIPFAQVRGGKNKPSLKNPVVDIHPEYFLILPKMFDDNIRSNFDEWVYALKNHAVKSTFKAAGIKEAGRKMDYLKMSPEEKLAHDRYLCAMHDLDAQFETAFMKGEMKSDAKWSGVVAEKDAALTEKDTALAEKDAALTEKDTALAEKDATISDQAAALAKAHAELAELKARQGAGKKK